MKRTASGVELLPRAAGTWSSSAVSSRPVEHAYFAAVRWERAGRGHARGILVRTDAQLVEAQRWMRGASGDVLDHGPSRVTIEVLQGAVLVERWQRGLDGAFEYARSVLQPGGGLDLPPFALVRVAAIRDASVLWTSRPPDARPTPAPRALLPVLELCRTLGAATCSTSFDLRAPGADASTDADA